MNKIIIISTVMQNPAYINWCKFQLLELRSKPTCCKGNSSWGISGSCVLNDSIKYLHFQHNPIMKLIFRRYNLNGFKGFTWMIYFLSRYEYIKEFVHWKISHNRVQIAWSMGHLIHSAIYDIVVYIYVCVCHREQSW